MRVKVVSIVPVNYVNKRDERVSGSEVHFLRSFNEREKEKSPRGTQYCDKVFTRLDCSNVQPEKPYDLVYECNGGRYAELVEIKAAS